MQPMRYTSVMRSEVVSSEDRRKQFNVRLRLSSVAALTRIAAAETLVSGEKVTQQDLLDRAIDLLIAQMETKHQDLLKRDDAGQGD